MSLLKVSHSRRFAALIAIAALAGCAGLVRDRIFQPVPVAETPVRWTGTAPQELSVTTADGLLLRGYFWAPRDGQRDVIVYFHGNGFNQLVGAARAEPLAAAGHGVLVASYRGYGGNPGEPSEAGLFRDADAWMARAAELAPTGRRYLFGHSLGGAVALEMAGRHSVAGVATLGTFTSMTDMVPGIARGSLTDRFDNRAAIARVTAPVFLYHGTTDQTVPFAAAADLQRSGGPGRVTVVPLEGGGHHVSMERLAPLVWNNFGATR